MATYDAAGPGAWGNTLVLGGTARGVARPRRHREARRGPRQVPRATASSVGRSAPVEPAEDQRRSTTSLSVVVVSGLKLSVALRLSSTELSVLPLSSMSKLSVAL